ncbi:hypothetical protein A9A71_121456 [Stutzerimonas stutzeri]|nr:hypothetical protein A9A71_121456 [Stutzerimonas stutzeri]
MEDLHFRLPAKLKRDFSTRCEAKNISMTSALILMIDHELKSGFLANETSTSDSFEPLGFFFT